MMTINGIGPTEIKRRKTVSDEINNTDDLTFENNRKRSSHGEAARKVRDKLDSIGIEKLCCQDDVSELEELFNSL